MSAAQLDNTLNTTSLMLQWLPTTGEFGLYGTFGDFDYHEKLATRAGRRTTRTAARTSRASRARTRIENSQIRLTDGSIIFTPDLFGPGITVEKVDYDMASVDGGLKYKGLSLEAEYYWRWLSDFRARTPAASPTSTTTASRCRPRRWSIPKALQVYLGGSAIRGDLRRQLGGARGRELVPRQGARPPRQRGVAAPEQVPGGLHRRSLSRSAATATSSTSNFELNF